MLHLSAGTTFHYHHGATDMRKGFDSLCGLVQQALDINVMSGSIFIFMNRKRNQVKLLLWEGDGFALYHKRLEKGTYDLPDIKHATISAQQLQLILQGIQLRAIKKKVRYQHTTV